ncbi:MAG: plastocyanin [Mycobacterium sp.]
MSRRTQRIVVALSTAAMGSFLLAACVAANQPAARPSPTLSTHVASTPGMPGMSAMPQMSAMPMMPPSANGNPPAAPIGPNAVIVDGFAFAPATLTVTVGSTVWWTNEDDDPHTVEANGDAFRSRVFGSGGTYSFTFPAAGTFD